LFKLLLYGVLENFGYRQINSFWRFEALIQYLMGKRKWELVHKKGHEEHITTDADGLNEGHKARFAEPPRQK
jgi:hypothetical protein